MNSFSIELIEDLNALLVRFEGKANKESLTFLYDQVLGHRSFQKHRNVIWKAANARISELGIEDFIPMLDYVLKTAERRGKSFTAWVFPDGEDYTRACAFKAASTDTGLIFPEIFTDLSEAMEWIGEKENQRRSETSL
ncbi:hypothetical protein [Pelagicoccus sp. SDUM812003]|uniref:hypothetical protein n=1 Tax=Pelagicoccus sp. SDUM812003 TaxID=3041267 RepID=UPI0028107A71|nr:hypothetical protein [Pelagicoccus sp. SDUM812003]MDQ8204924.1 hypothetical protein [Pelagicoccus sp. SDUM812003]